MKGKNTKKKKLEEDRIKAILKMHERTFGSGWLRELKEVLSLICLTAIALVVCFTIALILFLLIDNPLSFAIVCGTILLIVIIGRLK